MIYRYRAGIPWADLPSCFSDPKIIHQRFRRWGKKRRFDCILRMLADNEYVMLEAMIVQTTSTAPGSKKGAAKPLAAREALNNRIAMILTSSQAHDDLQAPALLAEVTPGAGIADEAYDADGLIMPMVAAGVTPVAFLEPIDADATMPAGITPGRKRATD